MMFDDDDFVASVRKLAEEHQGPLDVRVPATVLLRLVSLAESPPARIPTPMERMQTVVAATLQPFEIEELLKKGKLRIKPKG